MGSRREYWVRWKANNPDKVKAAQDRHRLKLKRDVIDHYGGKCKCCGERRLPFLTIDHIKGGGTQHRLSLEVGVNKKVGGRRFYQLLRLMGYPKGYCVLCWNCNCGRALNGGVCPHKDRRHNWARTK